MNKKILMLALLVITFITSCQSAQQKEIAATQNIANARQDLRDAQASNADEWRVFKAKALTKIAKNERKIAKLKVKMNRPGKTLDGIYRNKIEKLENKNNELKSRLNNYDGNETQWKTFKSDFNRDMNEIGRNIKDLFR
jgi:ABC-type enterochelin transport system substrate-binding protein